MLMLERASESGVISDSECNDPAVLLACALGSDGCPAKCQKDSTTDEDGNKASNISDMPIAGDLSIAVADYSSSVKSAPAVGTVVFNAVDFKASEKVVIESVKLERTGLSDKSNIKGVWFEKDGVAVSAKASLSTDGTVTTRFYNNYSVNGTDTLDLVVELSGSAGAEIAFNIIGVTSTAKNSSFNTSTTTYRTTDYKVAEVEFQINGGASTDKVEYKVGDSTSFEIGKFSITNNRPTGVSEDRDVVVKSLKLKNNGGLDLGDTFKNVYVTRDSKTVSKRVDLDGKTMTIYFDNDELASGKKGIYTIFAEVAQLNEVGKSVQLYLNKNTELVANEINSNFRVAYTTNANNMLKEYIFQGGKVTFTNDSSMSKTVNAAGSSTDVVIAKGTLTISEPVRLNKIVFEATDSTGRQDASTSKIIKNLKLEIGGSTYNTTASCNDNTSSKAVCTYTTDDDEIYVSKTSDIRVLVDLRNIADGHSVTFASLKGSSIEGKSYYDNSDESFTGSDVAGSIQLANLTVKAGKFNLTNTSSSTKKVVINSSDEVTIFDGEITSKDGTISVNELVLSGAFIKGSNKTETSLDSSEQIDLTLYVNGDAFRTLTYRGSEKSKSFANLGEVTSGNAMKIKIVAQPNMAQTGYIDFTVSANGSDSNGNEVKATSVSASRLEITESATATIASSNSDSTVIKDGSNAEILSFTVTAKDGSYDLTKVSVAGTFGSSNIKNATLSIDGSDIDSTNASASAIEFPDLNETLSEGKHTFTVKANVTAGTGNANSILSISGVTLTDANQNTSTATLGVSKLVANSYPTISYSTSSNDLYLTVTNPSNSEDDIEVLGFLVNGEVVNASIKGSTLSLWESTSLKTLISAKNVSIAAGESVEFNIQAAKSATVTVNGIIIKEDGQTLVINSNYTNVGKWSSFKVTANGDTLPASYYTLTAGDSDTTISGTGSYTKTVSDLAITGTTASVESGSNISFTATATYSDASTADVTATATWSFTPTGAASGSIAGGVFTASAAGTWTISATIGSITKSIEVTITAAAS